MKVKMAKDIDKKRKSFVKSARQMRLADDECEMIAIKKNQILS